MLLIIDNYDSFTYNLVQYFRMLDIAVHVAYNDAISLEQIEALNPSYLVISPGPGQPRQAGISRVAIKKFAGEIPILGVCLGHQALAEVYGATIVLAEKIMHGKVSQIYHCQSGLFSQLANPMSATRYHSLLVNKVSLPADFMITAWTQTAEGEIDEIMAIQHKQLPLYGVQFHPESILTEHGKDLLQNFLSCGVESSSCHSGLDLG